MASTRFYKPLLGLLLCVVIIMQACNNMGEILTLNPDLESKDNILTCSHCSDFGHTIAFSENQMMVAEYQNVYIYENENGVWKLKFEMINQKVIGVSSIEIQDSRMAIGLADENGTGRVEIYYKENDAWGLEQTLSANRDQDNFGSAIDISGNKMIIGASGTLLNGDGTSANEVKGRVYIYKREGTSWTKEAEFMAENSTVDDRFGQAAAVYENYAFAGGNIEGLHIYKFDDTEWALDSLLNIQGVTTIARSENNLMVRNAVSNQPQLLAFSIDSNNDLITTEINYDFGNEELSDHGEVLEMYQDLALVDYENAEFCDLLEFSNGSWSKRDQLIGKEGIFCEYSGLAITDNRVAIGGNNYVFIKEL